MAFILLQFANRLVDQMPRRYVLAVVAGRCGGADAVWGGEFGFGEGKGLGTEWLPARAEGGLDGGSVGRWRWRWWRGWGLVSFLRAREKLGSSDLSDGF